MGGMGPVLPFHDPSNLGVQDYHHETMSKRMLEFLVDANHVDLETEDVRYVQGKRVPA